jgi:copper chaperone CopZ
MATFKVEKMSCGGCVKHVTKAIQSIDAGADVKVDLANGLVDVTPDPINPQAIALAITQAGYPAQLNNS